MYAIKVLAHKEAILFQKQEYFWERYFEWSWLTIVITGTGSHGIGCSRAHCFTPNCEMDRWEMVLRVFLHTPETSHVMDTPCKNNLLFVLYRGGFIHMFLKSVTTILKWEMVES